VLEALDFIKQINFSKLSISDLIEYFKVFSRKLQLCTTEKVLLDDEKN
jgi:hypothetical protein